jgi:hypothetical protein
MKRILILILIIFTSCDDTEYFEFPEIEYKFNIDGRTFIDNNGYYHLTINPSETQQTLHRFGAEVTNIDKWGLPTQVIWYCDDFWSVDFFNSTSNVPIINSTSYADPLLDSVFCIMAPIGGMIGDTIEIKGTAYFEEGSISLHDSFQIIFE